MNILQITPGAGGMYCGACLRDNSFVKAFRRQGHSVTLLPLYLPMKLDDEDQTRGMPIFFGGLNVYLDEKIPLFRRLPQRWTRWMDSPHLLKRIGGFAGKTRPEELGDLTISMLKGEDGNQARELDGLMDWIIKKERPDVINLSNVMLLGLVKTLKKRLDVPVITSLQGEDSFLDRLPKKSARQAWKMLFEKAQDVDHFISPSRYFGEKMQQRIGFSSDRLSIVPNGIDHNEIDHSEIHDSDHDDHSSILGYFARMCEEKGLSDLIEAFIILKKKGSGKTLKLKVGGGLSNADQAFLRKIKGRLSDEGLIEFAEFHPNLDRKGKLDFFKNLSIFSVPASDGEAFGLYVIEAMAAGVPVVQPRHAAFPEIIEATGGGILFKSGDVRALAEGIETLLLDPTRARKLGEKARASVFVKYNLDEMARRIVKIYQSLITQ